MAVTDVAEVSVGGSPMAIHTARPDGGGKRAAVIVIQEIFGVNNDVRSIAERFAGEGYFAAAPEMFHRSGKGLDIPFSEMERAFGERSKLSEADIRADVQATIDYLRSNPGVDGDRIGIVGFCFGGMVSYLGATRSPTRSARWSARSSPSRSPSPRPPCRSPPACQLPARQAAFPHAQQAEVPPASARAERVRVPVGACAQAWAAALAVEAARSQRPPSIPHHPSPRPR